MNKKTFSNVVGILLLLIVSSVCYIGLQCVQSNIENTRLNDNQIKNLVVKNDSYGVSLKENTEKMNLVNTSIVVSVYKHSDGRLDNYLAKFATTINTPREEFTEDNFYVEFNDEYIVLELYDKDGKLEEKHRFNYDDLVEDNGGQDE